MISIVAAVAKNLVIGKDGAIPWKLPNDVSFFVKITTGCPVVMGRKTFESIGKPLKNRTNIILTRDESYKQEGCLVYSDIKKVVEDFGDKNLMVIGGQEIYRQFLPYTDKLYITYIDKDFEGDTFFPEIDFNVWSEVEREDIKDDPDAAFSYSFLKLEKTNRCNS